MLAQRYVREFDQQVGAWALSPSPSALLGSADIQSLADLANSFQVIQNMRVLPTRDRILTLGLFAVLPLAPLPLDDVLGP